MHITRQRLPSHKKLPRSVSNTLCVCSLFCSLPAPHPRQRMLQPQGLPTGCTAGMEPDSTTKLPGPGICQVSFSWQLPRLPRKGDLTNSQCQRHELRCSKTRHHFYFHYPLGSLCCGQSVSLPRGHSDPPPITQVPKG